MRSLFWLCFDFADEIFRCQKVQMVSTFSSEIFRQANLTNQNTLSCMCNSFMLSISVRQVNTPYYNSAGISFVTNISVSCNAHTKKLSTFLFTKVKRLERSICLGSNSIELYKYDNLVLLCC